MSNTKNMENSKCYGYLRISTDKQNIDNCKKEILVKANSLGYNDIIWYEETKSGKIGWEKRQLGVLFNQLVKGDTLVTSEISRLSRTISDTMGFMAKISELGVKLYFTKSEFVIDNSVQSQILIFAYSLSAQIEREMISSRTKSGLQTCRDKGIKLGRPADVSVLDTRILEVKRLIASGLKMKFISKQLKVSSATLSRFVKKHNIKKA